ncbi:radical SAM protein [Candidatus Woesearchaeota archaeon]|nr:radical SAM protein [Candidatus Woesearchaeota archaeon]
MKFKRILLIVPPFPGVNQGKNVLLLGVGYISQYLLDNGIQNTVFDMRLGYSVKDLKKIILEYRPDLIGMQIMTYRHDIAYDIINEIVGGNYKIVLGGHHVSTIDAEILRQTKADFAIRMEGEDAMLELCQGKPYETIKNLIYRKDGKIIQNSLRPFIEDLDRLTFPRYERFELSKYDEQLPITTSRGCPFQCIYCPCAATIGRLFRVRSPEDVIKELNYWYHKGHKRFAFVDDNFTLFPERVHKLCRLIEKNCLKDLDIYCQGIRADKVNLELLKTMRKAGFSQLGIGVEVGNDKMLKIIKKGEKREHIEQAAQWAIEVGFDVQFYCMIGLPYETVQDVEETFQLALKFPIADVHFHNVIPFPKTELYEWVKKNNYSIGDLDKSLIDREHFSRQPFFETPELPAKERIRLLKKAQKIEKIVLKHYFTRKMTPSFGRFSGLLAFFFFFGPIHKLVTITFQTKMGKFFIRTFLDKYHIDVHYY